MIVHPVHIWWYYNFIMLPTTPYVHYVNSGLLHNIQVPCYTVFLAYVIPGSFKICYMVCSIPDMTYNTRLVWTESNKISLLPIHFNNIQCSNTMLIFSLNSSPWKWQMTFHGLQCASVPELRSSKKRPIHVLTINHVTD